MSSFIEKSIRRMNCQRRGVVILFAVLLVSIVLTISLTLLNITYKQLVLSAIARESQFAYFAANSALECVKHWDSFDEEINPFGYIDISGTYPNYSYSYVSRESGTIDCNNASFDFTRSGALPTYIYSLTVVFDHVDKKSCAQLAVTHQLRGSGSSLVIDSQLESRGYNLYDDSGNCPTAGSDRTVERAARFGTL